MIMKRYFLDAALLIIFLSEMSFQFMPHILHEILGLVMAAVIVCHSVQNRNWFFNFSRGKSSRRKIFSTLINFSMLITVLVTLVSGICMSNYIFNEVVPLDIRRNITIHQLHVSTPYLMMIFVGLHIGLHFQEIFQRLKHFLGVKTFSTPQKVCGYIFFAAIMFAGIYGAFLNRLDDRLLMKHIFATPATELPFAIFVILFLSTMAIFVALGFWLDRKILR